MLINKAEHAANLPPTAGYQYARKVGNQLFVAGQVPHDSMGQLVGINDPYTQTAQCLHNLGTLLSVHGFTQADIQRLVIYVVGDHEHLATAWNAVKDWFPGSVPPATLLGVACLGYRQQLVEVDATVIKAERIA